MLLPTKDRLLALASSWSAELLSMVRFISFMCLLFCVQMNLVRDDEDVAYCPEKVKVFEKASPLPL